MSQFGSHNSTVLPPDGVGKSLRTQSHQHVHYTGGLFDLVQGSTVVGGSSGAIAVLSKIPPLNTTASGHIILLIDESSPALTFTAGEALTVGGTTFATVSTVANVHIPEMEIVGANNPFNALFQNCTEFVLDVLFAAIYGTSNVHAIKANITAYFDPHPILIDAAKLTFAAETMPDVTLDDHSGLVATTTFSSIAKFLMGQGIAREAFILTTDPSTLHVGREEIVL